MTDKQPEALRLADEFDATKSYLGSKVAAELRLQHSQIEYLSGLVAEKNKMIAELVEALSVVIRGVPDTWDGVQKAKVVLDKAKESNHG